MGGQFQRHNNRRTLDEGGGGPSHQLSGAVSRPPCPEGVCSCMNSNNSTLQDGQCDGNCQCEQNGGHIFRNTIQPSNQIVGVMLVLKNTSTCRTPPGQREHQSGFGVQTFEELQQLNAK